MRKVLSVLLAVALVFGLTGCFEAKEKEFSGSGMTLTLTEDFVEKDVVQAQLYLESLQTIFMGSAESKSAANSVGINSLQGYIDAVIKNSKKTANVEEFNEDGVNYFYAYYTSEVDGNAFGYMLVCMEGESKYYSMNFGCKEKNLEKNKEQYSKWAKAIKVA